MKWEEVRKIYPKTKLVNANGHPARFPQKLPEFFINFLTNSGDIVLDIFAGSNTTGAAAESLNRHWLAFEIEQEYLASSAFRFIEDTENDILIKDIYSKLKFPGASNILLSDKEAVIQTSLEAFF